MGAGRSVGTAGEGSGVDLSASDTSGVTDEDTSGDVAGKVGVAGSP